MSKASNYTQENALHFLMVTTFYPPYNFGGDGIFVHRLSNELASRGHRVDVVHCVDAHQTLSGTPIDTHYENHENVRVFALKSLAGPLSPVLTQQTGKSLLKSNHLKSLVERNEYDVIHYHNISLIGLDVLAFGSAVKLYTMHEYWLVCPTHVLWKFSKELCLEQSCFRCQLQAGRPVQWWRYTNLMKKYLSHVDCFLAPSLFARDKHYELGFDFRIEHLPNFLTRTADKISSPESNSRGVLGSFLFVGRLEKIKGLQDVLPIFLDNPEYDLLVAGDGDFEPELRRMAANARNIKFLGRLTADELETHYRQACAVIVPSVCYEIFAMVVIEAFAQGTPVLANKVGALPELIERSAAGFLFENSRELLAGMKKLHSDPKLRNELGARGYAAYQENWSEEPHIRRYLELIGQVAGEDRSLNSEAETPREALAGS